MDNEINELTDSVQRYGEECPTSNADEQYTEAYRQGWSDALEELKRQLTPKQ